MSSILYDRCTIQTSGDIYAVLECVARSVEQDNVQKGQDTCNWLLLLAGSLVFAMQIGFAMLCAGCVRTKNVQNTMLKNLLDACGGAVAFYTIGYAFAFGGQNDTSETTFAGNANFFLRGEVDFSFWFYEYCFAAASVTIVAGTVAERCKMSAYLLYSVILVGAVYPIVAHAIWSTNGFLSAFAAAPFRGVGVLDFAGSGVVHLTGGVTALIAAWVLGPRKGRFHDANDLPLAEPKVIKGHSMALQLLGTMILWFGWYGFNPGSALLLTATDDTAAVGALAAVNTTLSGSAGALAALFTSAIWANQRLGELNMDLTSAMNGCLSGLVAITAGCGTVQPGAAIFIGVVAGWLYLASSWLLVKLRIDDAVNAVPVHLSNGMWGVIATGLLSAPEHILQAYGISEHVGMYYSLAGGGGFDGTLIGNQVLAVVCIISWTGTVMLPFFLGLNALGWFAL